MTPVVIMAGGMGMRLRPLTENTPKPMLPVNGKPLLEWILLRFIKQGFNEFHIAVRYLGKQIEDHFGDGTRLGARITYLHEEIPLGTAGALSLLENPSEPFIVSNADVLVSLDYAAILRYHETHNAIATVGATTHRVHIPFGVLSLTDYCLTSLHEKPTLGYPIASGVYVLSPAALEYLPKGAVDMPQLLKALLDKGKVSVFPIAGDWLDVGTWEDFKKTAYYPHE